jgi:hypothetical protein
VFSPHRTRQDLPKRALELISVAAFSIYYPSCAITGTPAGFDSNRFLALLMIGNTEEDVHDEDQFYPQRKEAIAIKKL